MRPLAFIGGAISGAAGLIAVALWDQKRTESAFSPLLKTPGELDARDTAKQLNCYFFKAQQLYSKCNQIVMDSTHLISTPISLPDDGVFQKAANFLGGGATRACRGWRENELRNLKVELKNLYGRFRGVFRRANQLIADKNGSQADLKALGCMDSDPMIDNSLDNDNWDTEFMAFADSIRGYIERTCEAAEKLISQLDERASAANEPEANNA